MQSLRSLLVALLKCWRFIATKLKFVTLKAPLPNRVSVSVIQKPLQKSEDGLKQNKFLTRIDLSLNSKILKVHLPRGFPSIWGTLNSGKRTDKPHIDKPLHIKISSASFPGSASRIPRIDGESMLHKAIFSYC